ncbi:MAG: HAD hydrolase-like protein, partial [Clostridia bacterium]
KENILTSGQACGMFLKEKKKNPICYVVGTSALKKELESYGVIICDEKVQSPDFLVVGYDTELEYKKLEKACQLLNENVPFIATNCDLVCPMGKESFLPDCGLFCHMLTVATKKQPYYIGKPNPDMINFLLNKYSIEKNKAIMIGDRIYTDIASGINAQINTALVLSGECTIEDLEKSNIKPTIVVQSVKDFL